LGTLTAEIQGDVKVLVGDEDPLGIVECWLLHGTSNDCARKIVAEGFDHRLCRQGMHGSGAYFTSQSCKAHQYTCEHHMGRACLCEGERTMIVTRVALGNAYIATERLGKEVRRTPELPDGKGYIDGGGMPW
jgi:hypothetical protein